MCVQVGVCVCVCVRVWVSIWVQYFGNYFALLVVVTVVTLTPLWTPALKFGGGGLSFYLSWEYELPFADIWQIDIFIFATQYFFSCFVNFGAFSLPPTCPEYSSKWKFAGTFCPAAGEKTKKIRWKFEKGFVSFLFPISFFFFFAALGLCLSCVSRLLLLVLWLLLLPLLPLLSALRLLLWAIHSSSTFLPVC